MKSPQEQQDEEIDLGPPSLEPRPGSPRGFAGHGSRLQVVLNRGESFVEVFPQISLKTLIFLAVVRRALTSLGSRRSHGLRSFRRLLPHLPLREDLGSPRNPGRRSDGRDRRAVFGCSYHLGQAIPVADLPVFGKLIHRLEALLLERPLKPVAEDGPVACRVARFTLAGQRHEPSGAWLEADPPAKLEAQPGREGGARP